MTSVEHETYVIRADSDSWEPDDEVGGLMQVLFEEGDAAAGLWKPGDQGSVEGNVLSARESVIVLRGTVRVEIIDGPTLELTQGDVASLPKGANVSWFPSPDFVKVWVSH